MYIFVISIISKENFALSILILRLLKDSAYGVFSPNFGRIFVQHEKLMLITGCLGFSSLAYNIYIFGVYF
jgi:hypothetical protein